MVSAQFFFCKNFKRKIVPLKSFRKHVFHKPDNVNVFSGLKM